MPFIELDGRRVLLVHIPKTGGTSICTYMSGLAPLRFMSQSIAPNHLKVTPQHLPYAQMEQLFGTSYFDAVFAITRDPFTRMESEYRFRTAVGGDGLKDRPSFSAWFDHAMSLYRQNPFAMDNHLRPQWHFLGDAVEVFRYEEDGVARCCAAIAKALGQEAPETIPRRRVSQSPKEPVTWDSSQREMMEDVYKRDFSRAGLGAETI